MLHLPRDDEHAAQQFEDIASALDAGLPVQAIGGDPALGDAVLHGILRQRRVSLTATESAVLAAGWRSGRAGHVLRRAATRRRQRADAGILLLKQLAYPAMVLALATVVALLNRMWIVPVVIAGVAAAVGLVVWRLFAGLRAGKGPWLRLPLLGPLLLDAAELPYLEVLHGLYAAGTGILEAHPRAVASCPYPAVRERLQAADQVLQGRMPLADAWRTSAAVHQETLALVAPAERVGELEDALWRALQRRSEVHHRRLQALVRRIGGAAYAFAVLVVLYVVAAFYAGYYAPLRQLLR